MKKQFILPRLFLLGSSFTACQVSNQAIDHAIEIRLPNEAVAIEKWQRIFYRNLDVTCTFLYVYSTKILFFMYF
ncbi:hypothetical protein [Candidatus Cardinium hertigii]|jgi:hypothetical protein|uniref:Uncharacterized protein n=1 Tax=Candidatus Cardinium hertigii TaxID=247481 RepID=A0A3N2QD99_9BACT|nr:hypothetical protein [Candidatus Cardinium hertigii]ROT47767.1 hypothetical protein EDM02_00555 [Candidatus Cardinium hertigii]ROT47769.1 hypothetical protein EDM02_00565 [Candidatus Cardinium hertigii]